VMSVDYWHNVGTAALCRSSSPHGVSECVCAMWGWHALCHSSSSPHSVSECVCAMWGRHSLCHSSSSPHSVSECVCAMWGRHSLCHSSSSSHGVSECVCACVYVCECIFCLLPYFMVNKEYYVCLCVYVSAHLCIYACVFV